MDNLCQLIEKDWVLTLLSPLRITNATMLPQRIVNTTPFEGASL